MGMAISKNHGKNGYLGEKKVCKHFMAYVEMFSYNCVLSFFPPEIPSVEWAFVKWIFKINELVLFIWQEPCIQHWTEKKLCSIGKWLKDILLGITALSKSPKNAKMISNVDC